jgi:sulfonate transport system substrate-binding protein
LIAYLGAHTRIIKIYNIMPVKIRIGGVPEHFNLPIHIANESGAFGEQDIEIEWTDFKGGTGQMAQALREDKVDICVILTEGIIKDIINGNPSKIISQYVITPLIWGIHTGVNNTLSAHKDIYDKNYAISRFGSGSHLMAIVDANSQNRQISKDQFVVINNLEGALESLGQGDTDVFYWEKYTTKPYVDNGQLRRVGEYRTPWPCFVIAAREEILKKRGQNISQLLKIIHDSCRDFMQNEQAIELVSQRYHLEVRDVERWYHCTEWATHGWVSDKMMKSVVFNLHKAGIIEEDAPIPELIWKRS